MTDYEHIFLEPDGLGAEESALVLARTLQMRYVKNDHGHLVGREWTDEQGRHVVGGDVDCNIFVTGPEDGPDASSIIDNYPLVWSLAKRPAANREEVQAAVLEVFRELVASNLEWPMALVTGFDWLIAVYDVERGLRVFPTPDQPRRGRCPHLAVSAYERSRRSSSKPPMQTCTTATQGV